MFDTAAILRTARNSARLTPTQLSNMAGRAPSTVTRIESGSTQPSAALMAELLMHCGWELRAEPTDPIKPEENTMPSAPTTYPNPRNDDPWDNDAIHWLLTHSDVAAAFKRGPLFECLRRQPGRLRNQPERVAEAAELARRHGVIQKPVYDAKIGKQIVRLIRTDPEAPTYPW